MVLIYGIWKYEQNGESISLFGTTEEASLGSTNSNYTLTLPSHINDIPVTSITTEAFINYEHINTVSLPTSITTIGQRCFQGCTGLSVINLSHVTSIKDAAFYLCASLKNIYLTSIENISYSCFQQCTSLINITFSNKINHLAGWAFFGCTKLDVVTITNSITGIGEKCFEGCSKLTSISLGEGVTSIGEYAFYGCGLASVFMPPQLTINGIGVGAFLNQPDTFKITMPHEYLKDVSGFDAKFPIDSQNNSQTNSWTPYYIFDTEEGNDTLTSTIVDSSATHWDITTEALDKKFKGQQIPGTVVYIGKNVKTIGVEAFSIVGYMTNVYIGKTVETISYGAFSGLSELKNFYISDDVNSVFDCSLLEIGVSAFKDCTLLSMLIIPTSVTTIGQEAFFNCGALSDIISYSGSNLETIGISAFQDCNNVNIVQFPNSLITIGANAFNGCTALINIIFPDTVTHIGESAFGSCTILQNVTISKNIQFIGANAFYECDELTMVKNIPYSFKATLNTIFSRVDKKKYPHYTRDRILWLYARGQTQLNNSLTYSAKAITASSMGWSNVVNDQSGYFVSDSPKVYDKEGIVLYNSARMYMSAGPEVWVSIPHWNNGNGKIMFVPTMSAKRWAENWTRNYTPHYNNLLNEESNALVTMNDQKYTVDQLIPAAYIYRVEISRTETELTRDMVKEILGDVDATTIFSVTIVDSDANNIVTIGESAFVDYGNNINAITFSNKITTIEQQAFEGCLSLKGKITLPESMITIANRAFQSCQNITSVYLPKSIVSIGWSAFNTTGLTMVSLFKNNIFMQEFVFTNCPNLANVTAPPPPLTNVPAFYGESFSKQLNNGKYFNTNINTQTSSPINFSYRVYFTPDSTNNLTHEMVKDQNPSWNSTPFIAYIADVTDSTATINIAANAFEGSSMSKLFITGNTPKNIGADAFKSCSKLAYVYLSDSVQSIGQGAFVKCSSLVTISIPSRLHTVGTSDYFSQGDQGDNAISTFIFNYLCILSPTSNGILTSYDVNTQIGTSSGFTQGVTISFDSSVTIIETDAFNGNENILSLIIPSTVTSIGEYAFANCPNLVSVTSAPNSSLIFIDNYAFHNCINLSSVYLPFALEVIGIGAFMSCTKLWTVTLPYLFDCVALTQTTSYFETAYSSGTSWTSSDPTAAGGTFFTFNFEHSNGLFTSYSYAKEKYITAQIAKAAAVEAAKEKKDAIWNDIGYAALSIVMAGLIMTGVGALADAIMAPAAEALMAEEGSVVATSAVEESATATEEETSAEFEDDGVSPDSAERDAANQKEEDEKVYNNPGKQLERQRKLDAFKRRNLINRVIKVGGTGIVYQFIPLKKSFDGANPFQFSPMQQKMYGTSTTIYVNHEPGSWIINIVMNTNLTDIGMVNLDEEINTSIVSYLDTKYTTADTAPAITVRTTHATTYKYEIKITVDTDYDDITEGEKSVVNNIIQESLEPYANQWYLVDTMLSDICFSKHTPIVTDQGVVNIEDINTSIHSIRCHPIHHITKSISMFKHLVCFEKDCMGKNYPSKRTVVSQEHNIYHGGKLVPASDLLDKYNDVKLVPYHGEVLYNILMKDHNTVVVNNMICETLHPDNVVAKIYNTNNEYERSRIFVLLKEHIKNKEYSKYMKFVNKIMKTVPNTITSQKRKPSKLMQFHK